MTFHSPLLRAFTPKQLFRAGEKGVWYDPSDMSTLWQDSARTTAVTAVEQPVGCIDDKSGNGVNATQSTSASRPVLSARVNLLTKTEDFTNAVWVKNACTVSGNLIKANATSNTFEFYGTGSGVAMVLGTSYKLTFRAEYSNTQWLWVRVDNPSTSWAAFDLLNGVVGNKSDPSSAITSFSMTASSLGGYVCTIIWTCTGGSSATNIVFNAGTGSTPTNASITWAGTEQFYLYTPDMRVNNDGTGLPIYQRVDTSSSYDTTGFPMYIKFDGTDDFLSTGSIDFSGTNNISTFTGLRKIAGTPAVFELSTAADANNGSFALFYDLTTGAFSSRVRGTAWNDAVSGTTYTSPLTNVVTTTGNIPGSLNTVRVNGSATTNTASLGTGNFGNYALYIGSRAGTSLRMNGRLYSLIIRGASSTTGQIADSEGWVNSRTRAY